MSPLLRIGLLVGLVLFGLAALVYGAAVISATWAGGPIEVSYDRAGRKVVETITAATDPERYRRWRLLGGWLPLVAGAAAMAIGIHLIRR